MVTVRNSLGAKDPPKVTIPEVRKTSSCSKAAFNRAVAIKVSRLFNLALLMTELNTEVDNDGRDPPAHMGENKKMSGCWIKHCIWDPGTVAIKMLSRISPLVSMDVEDHWGSNMDVAAILGKIG